MRILVIGGYGLIGSAICRHLHAAGHDVTGLGRSAATGARLIRSISWIEADLSDLTSAAAWLEHLHGTDAVINASGLLQSGLHGSAQQVQADAIVALVDACSSQGISRFIQISAPGATIDHETEFYRSKAVADECLKASSLNWTIFRPGLVISPNAFGGTLLLRMLAAFPFIQPVGLRHTQIQTVDVTDVAEAVCLSIADPRLNGDFDLVEPAPHVLRDILLEFRDWLGFGKPAFMVSVPNLLLALVGRLADLAGWLGWRSALRTTSLRVLHSPVAGSSDRWTQITGHRPKSLTETLANMPATFQDRVSARASLAFPVLLAVLSIFWIVSGIVGLWQHEQARHILQGRLPGSVVDPAIWVGSVADILIGLGLLARPLVRLACYASIALSSTYLVAATLFVPELWADPLGPLVKVFPVIACSLAVAALAERR